MAGGTVDVDYLVPRDLDEALRMRASGVEVISGGTDYFPVKVGRPLTGSVLDVSAVPEFRGIEVTPDAVRFGAAVTWGEIARADLPARFDGLREAAREVGAVQVQNAGTIAGNLCTASPAADGLPTLLALDASVELVSASGVRALPVSDFVTGYRSTALRPDELVSAVMVPRGRDDARSVFLKLGLRRYLVISVVMCGAVLEVDDGAVSGARIAVGACSPVARRLHDLERDLVGRPVDDSLPLVAGAQHLSVLTPIDDVRASAAYRSKAALILVRRAIASCAGLEVAPMPGVTGGVPA